MDRGGPPIAASTQLPQPFGAINTSSASAEFACDLISHSLTAGAQLMKTLVTILAAALTVAACGSQSPTPAAPPPADQTAALPPATAPAEPNYEGGGRETAYTQPPPQPVVSVYEDAPDTQPAPVEVGWAPPPMLVEPPPPPPSTQYVWTGGYWGWYGNWVWIHGRWAPPPRPQYHWVQPYYDHRGNNVVFVSGFWGAPNVSFVAPGIGVSLTLAVAGAGVIPGPPPMGPEGVFIPAPPGSRFGIIIPAPIGTPPAVVTGAPPVINVGMRINSVVTNTTVTNTTINNTVINNVTIVAPASATATHTAVNVSVPAQAHLAAAMKPVVSVMAPAPASAKPIAPYVPGSSVSLPPPQTVHAAVPPEMAHVQPAAAAGERPAGVERPAAEGGRPAMQRPAEPTGAPARSSAELKNTVPPTARPAEQHAPAVAARPEAAAKQADEKQAAAKEAATKQTEEKQAESKAAAAKQAETKQAQDAAAKKKAADAVEAKKKAEEKAAAEKKNPR